MQTVTFRVGLGMALEASSKSRSTYQLYTGPSAHMSSVLGSDPWIKTLQSASGVYSNYGNFTLSN
ncbi:uncharacterized protein PG998_005405 [Apiospora kogelbergensis]|uniref:Uncharacterized protein n=1 Tax=Apiospora kogelbergensis TaxID=1337665 RepID=A0AAW0Q8Y7_9PEZI